MNLVERYILRIRSYRFFIESHQIVLEEGVITGYSIGFNSGKEGSSPLYNLGIAPIISMKTRELASSYEDIAGENLIELKTLTRCCYYCRTEEAARNVMDFMQKELCKWLSSLDYGRMHDKEIITRRGDP